MLDDEFTCLCFEVLPFLPCVFCTKSHAVIFHPLNLTFTTFSQHRLVLHPNNNITNSYILSLARTMKVLPLLLPLTAKAAWIDEDTPQSLRTTTSLVDGTTYHLVMSDEFNVPGRTFADGHDPTWTALDKSDDDYSASGGGSLHFYNSTTVTTTPDGMLTIRTVIDPTEWTHYDAIEKEYKREKKYFKSGMLQSWDKFCFTGGIFEVDVILPGEPDIGEFL